MAQHLVERHADPDLTLSPSTTLYSPSPPFEKHSLPPLEFGSLDTSPFSDFLTDMIKDVPPIFQTRSKKTAIPADMSYDIERFTNPHNLESGWYDEDVEEVLILTPKRAFPEPEKTPFSPLSLIDVKPPAPEFDSLNSLPLAPPTLTTATRLCRKRDTGRIYVMKTFVGGANQTPLEYQILQIISDLGKPFLPRILWSFPGEKDLCIITDYYPRKNLDDLISAGGPLKPSEALFYASEIIYALSALYATGIVHRDLRPGNVMIDTDGHVVLTGFKHADFLPRNGSRDFFVSRPSPEPSALVFQAPELILGWAHDCSVDCWGFGVILYYILSGELLFSNESGSPSKIKSAIVHGTAVLCPLLDRETRDLISKCLERSTIARLTLGGIREHPYFSSVDWDQLGAKSVPVPHLVDPVFDSNDHICPLDVLPRKPSPSQIDSSASGTIPPAGSTLRPQAPLSTHSLSPGPLKRERRTVQSLPKISRMSSLLDDVPEEAEDTKSLKNYPLQDVSMGNSGICGDSTVSNNTSLEGEHENGLENEVNRQDRMAQFWASLDLEQEAGKVSTGMLSFARLGSAAASSRKLRKARSTMSVSVYPVKRFSTMSATSLHSKLRTKMLRSSRTSLAGVSDKDRRDSIDNDNLETCSIAGPPAVPPPTPTAIELPVGIKQIGSGIGFTYNLPTDLTRSKASICTASNINAPFVCHGILQGLGLVGLGLRIGNRFGSMRKGGKERGVKGSLTFDGVESFGRGLGAGESGDDETRGGSSWSLMAVPSGTVMIIGDGDVDAVTDGATSLDGALGTPPSMAAEVAVTVGHRLEMELDAGVVGCSSCEGGVRGCVDEDGELLTLRLLPSPSALCHVTFGEDGKDENGE